MRTLFVLSVIVLAVACSSATELGEIEISDGEAARLRTGAVAIYIPAGALADGVTLHLSSTEADIVGAVTPVFSISADDADTETLSRPLSIAVPAAGNTSHHIALLSEDGGLTGLDTHYDDVAGELRAQTRQLGSFVVVDQAVFSTAEVVPPAAEAPAGDPAAPVMNDFAFLGEWQGTDAYSELTMAFGADTFSVYQGGELIREGGYTAANNNLTMRDTNGDVESGIYQFEDTGSKLVMNVQSGQIVWRRWTADLAAETTATQAPAADPAADASDGYGAGGTSSGGNTASAGTGNAASAGPGPSSSAAAGTPAPGSSGTVAAADPQPAAANSGGGQPPKNFFERLGAGARNLGIKTFEGVKSAGRGISKPFKREPGDSPQADASGVSAGGNQADTGSPAGAQPGPQRNPYADLTANLVPGGGTTPTLRNNDACLLSNAELQQIAGFTTTAPRGFPADPNSEQQQSLCRYQNLEGYGTVSITFYKRTRGSVPDTWNRDLRNYPDRYRRIDNMGDDARWYFTPSNPPRLEAEVLLGNSYLNVEWQGGASYISNLTSADADKVIAMARLALSKLQ